MFFEQKRRSFLKTLSWRIIATLTTVVLVWVFTGKVVVAFSVGAFEFIIKMIIYFGHERVWDRVSYGRREIKPCVLWFTGLSGAGKSTLSEAIYEYLKDKGLKVEHLDGDKIRTVFPKTGFSKEERDNHIKRVGYLASMLEKQGVFVVSSFISPYESTRQIVRDMCIDFVEVYVNTPLAVCEKRDVKGLYKKARAGEIKDFTGVNDPYEPPVNPEINVSTDGLTVDESLDIVKKFLDKKYNV